ncbi:MAG: hypothetical protein LUF85_15630 [Bacteroides sp.]|nr:hypothetical protein [Bacteroides sp.]
MGRFLLGVLAGAALYHACNTRKNRVKAQRMYRSATDYIDEKVQMIKDAIEEKLEGHKELSEETKVPDPYLDDMMDGDVAISEDVTFYEPIDGTQKS